MDEDAAHVGQDLAGSGSQGNKPFVCKIIFMFFVLISCHMLCLVST